jgi:hypothetical protein
MLRLLIIVFCFGFSSMGLAQTGSGVKSGLNGNGGMTGANINTVNGISANGTPMQQLPGSSMTNGAGNSAMTPSQTVPPTVTSPTNNGTTEGTVKPGSPPSTP